MTGPIRRDTTNCWVSQRKVWQNGTLRHLHCPAVCPGQSWRWALLKKKHPPANLVKQNCFRCSGCFSLTWKGPQSEHQEVALDCSEGVTSKRKVTHNATLDETIMATETLGSENKSPFGKASCQCYVSFCECTVSEGVLEKSFPLAPPVAPFQWQGNHSQPKLFIPVGWTTLFKNNIPSPIFYR